MDERMETAFAWCDGTAYDVDRGLLVEGRLVNPYVPELVAKRMSVEDLELAQRMDGPDADVDYIFSLWPVEARFDASTPDGRAQAMAYLEGMSSHVAYGSRLGKLLEGVRAVEGDSKWQLDRFLGERDASIDADALGSVISTLSRPDDFYSAEARVLVVSYAQESNTPRDVEVWSGVDPEELARWVTVELRGKGPSEVGLADYTNFLDPNKCEAVVRIDDEAGMERLAEELTDPEEGYITGSEVIDTVARALGESEGEAVSRAVERMRADGEQGFPDGSDQHPPTTESLEDLLAAESAFPEDADASDDAFGFGGIER